MEMNRENLMEKKSCGTVSLLQGDEQFFNRVISRESSKGFSSRIYYRNAGVVPFKWEAQPGKPKNPPENESLPQISPPPAVISSGFARPCIVPAKEPMPIRVWKKIKRSVRGKMNQTEMLPKKEALGTTNGSECGQKMEFWSSDLDSFSSPARKSTLSPSSSSSSSFNSCNNRSTMPIISSKVENEENEDLDASKRFEGLDWPRGCTPWNITGVLVHVASRRG